MFAHGNVICDSRLWRGECAKTVTLVAAGILPIGWIEVTVAPSTSRLGARHHFCCIDCLLRMVHHPAFECAVDGASLLPT